MPRWRCSKRIFCIETSHEGAMRRFLSVTVSAPTNSRRLECESAPPPRAPLACLATVERSFSMRAKKVLACGDGCSGVSHSGATSTVRHAPMSDLRFRIRICRRGRTRGAALDGWGRACARNSLASRRRRRETLSLRRQDAHANVAGPASGVRSAGAESYWSQRLLVGTETVIDKNLLIDPPQRITISPFTNSNFPIAAF
jgi:hypothetical protein